MDTKYLDVSLYCNQVQKMTHFLKLAAKRPYNMPALHLPMAMIPVLPTGWAPREVSRVSGKEGDKSKKTPMDKKPGSLRWKIWENQL